ncbi:serine-threonine protein kinase, putative [Entamoeba invadens IP1]|uniref:serine-threonine protein kinase, putative n=1 Tax=Entamoeba invadens IP1 TaxID=370355 RepID=UPI0002C3E3B5|nr:serine-threonine protein kinase, putative [Entamoeba invadens IP1]ELP94153.1 serine-threonine protein kinase, putative [Entamoeba invadens IP1]|eukprot:XP_004260924.1 serine-threonine protein kinase, putative [Entamoeba invadens IP1]
MQFVSHIFDKKQLTILPKLVEELRVFPCTNLKVEDFTSNKIWVYFNYSLQIFEQPKHHKKKWHLKISSQRKYCFSITPCCLQRIKYMRMFFFIIFFWSTSSQVLCSSGCSSECISNYTCRDHCLEGYENDGSCLYCATVMHGEGVSNVYLPNGDKCILNEHLIEKDTWVPSITQKVLENETFEMKFGEDTYVDSHPCYHKQKYRLMYWYKLDYSQVTTKYIFITLNRKGQSNDEIYLDVSHSDSTSLAPTCYAQSTMKQDDVEMTTELLVDKNLVDKEYTLYYTVSVDGYSELNVDISWKGSDEELRTPYYYFTQEQADNLRKNIKADLDIKFPLSSQGLYRHPSCASNKMMKVLYFQTEFKGDYSIRIDTLKGGKNNYLQELSVDENGQSVCKKLWDGNRFGILAFENDEKEGLFVKLDGTRQTETKRLFAIMTEEHSNDITVTFRAICPNDCNAGNEFGYCSTKEAKCICKDGYGGSDCHKLCFHNLEWQVEDNTNLCYLDSSHCDEFCQCENGYSLKNHLCVSSACASNSSALKEECRRGREGCLPNCQCQFSANWFPTKSQQCKHKLCGNGEIDDLYDAYGFVRREECDGGVNCGETCFCLPGFVPNPSQPNSCKTKSVHGGAIAGIVCGGVLGLVIILTFIIFIAYQVLKYKSIDVDIFKQQQPEYYMYIQGSTNAAPTKESRYLLYPVDLDFGQRNGATAINDTRYEKIEIRNCSKKKHMMVIFHTPNNPKYVFHFEPQVVYVRPRGMVICTSYMTIHCTTRLRDTRIPYTVWFAESKGHLTKIADFLMNKSFVDWDMVCKNEMDKLLKGILFHYHHHLIIKTDAASSTQLDMDEMNMSEKPIAEGANGKVYIGNYRSVPVAVKQFRWENLSGSEMIELKKNVIQECEIMSKLRNPFIANYMGSVTYTPQVSMVIQFFVLGSLGEYLRKDRDEHLSLPYKLKVRMLYDTARGMQFLHENRIMHLDLKPDNLLVNSLYTDSACCIKITDFGTSRFTHKAQSTEKGLGTPIYLAPEGFKDVYTYAGDVYSFGITGWEIFYQDEPYKSFKSLFEIKTGVLNGKRPDIDNSMPSKLNELIEVCWKGTPSERPLFDEIVKKLIIIDEDVRNHMELDFDVFGDKIEYHINKRIERMKRLVSEIA